MGQIRRQEKKLLLFFGILYTAWFVLAAYASRTDHAVFDVPLFSMADRSGSLPTSTDFRYPEGFAQTLYQYEEFREMYREEGSTAIPGLVNTRLADSSSGQMVPQGICLAGEYLLLTAYDRTQRSNSVLYVLSNENAADRKLLTVIELPEKNHVGGIAFDGTRIWIAGSTGGYCSTMHYAAVEAAARSGEESCRWKTYEQQFYVGVTASFVTFHGGRLWVGTYRPKLGGKSSLTGYCIVEKNREITLKKESTVKIPSYAQGALFLEQGGSTFLLLSASGGKHRDSRLYLYEVSEALEKQGETSLSLLRTYRLPPMAETIACDGETIYLLFESAATCYSTSRYCRCAYPVDRICGVSLRCFFH